MNPSSAIHPELVPAELCGYSIVRSLQSDQSYLARGPGGRTVVLKRVDEDCLLGNQLHPSIKERLARVRELAHGGVANLHGVAREGDSAWLIWEYVAGRTFEEFVAQECHTPAELLDLARELVLAVDALHAQGIVHGAVIGTNVIVTPEGAMRLIHISPLLYTDMQADVECIISLLQDVVDRRGEQRSSLGGVLKQAREDHLSLRDLAAKIAALLEVRAETNLPEMREQERHIRRRTVVAAGFVGFVALVLAYGVWRATGGSAQSRPADWLMPSSTPDK